MALGGGTFISADGRGLPGSYTNFISLARASASLSDRGVATMPLSLDWGPDGQVFTVTAAEFQKNSQKHFGYPYAHKELAGLRELYQNITVGHFYKLNTGGKKAENSFATALCTGERGNALKTVIEAAEGSTDEKPVYSVETYLDTSQVDEQVVASAAELIPNDFVSFKNDATLALTAGTPLSGGTNGDVNGEVYQTYLDKIEPYSFNTMGCVTTDATVKGLLVAFTKRLRDQMGIKFQCVLFRPDNADHEGVIAVENGLVDAKDDPSAVYWVTGAEAGCAVNKSLTNTTYSGEFAIDVDYTQAELEAALAAGKLILHRVGDSVRVLSDINSFVSVTDEKSADFSSNQTVRVIDQIGNDIAVLFNDKYLGNLPNDDAGRMSLWNDIVKHHQELQAVRAIENFSSDDVTVEEGATKQSVAVTDKVAVVNAFGYLYMTVVVQ